MSRPACFIVPLFLLACTSDLVVPPEPETGVGATDPATDTTAATPPPPSTNCTLAFNPVGPDAPGGAVLFGVSPAGRITPEKRAVTVTASGCVSLPERARIAVALDSELAEWTVVDCETVSVYMVCGEVTPFAAGQTAMTATIGESGQPPIDSTSVAVVMNRVPWRKDRCEPGNNLSQLCRMVSLEFAVGETVQLDLDEYMEDADADSLIYAVDALNGQPLLRVADVSFNGSVMSLTGIAEGNASFSISVNDGWADFGWGLGPVQVGCPGLEEVAGYGTGRIVVTEGDAPVRLSECDSHMLDAALAYWERVLAADHRGVVVTLRDPGDNWLSSAWGSGSGPTDAPNGAFAVGRELGLLTSPAQYYDIIRHELAHVLGIGSGLKWWNLLRNRFTGDYANPPDTYFAGELAYQAFVEMGGKDFYQSEGVPVANGSPSNVQANTHWRSEIIDNDVMVSCDDVAAHYTEGNECGEIAPVSTITLGALADMGWIVDMNMAEPGTRTGCFRSCRDW